MAGRTRGVSPKRAELCLTVPNQARYRNVPKRAKWAHFRSTSGTLRPPRAARPAERRPPLVIFQYGCTDQPGELVEGAGYTTESELEAKRSPRSGETRAKRVFRKKRVLEVILEGVKCVKSHRLKRHRPATFSRFAGTWLFSPASRETWLVC